MQSPFNRPSGIRRTPVAPMLPVLMTICRVRIVCNSWTDDTNIVTGRCVEGSATVKLAIYPPWDSLVQKQSAQESYKEYD